MDHNTLHNLLVSGKETVAVRVLNSCQSNYDFANITLQVVHVAKTSNYDSFGFYDNYFDHKHQYKGLQLIGQMSRNVEGVYGIDIGISNHGDIIKLEDAISAAKLLKTINRKLIKMAEVEGHHADFSEYAMRFCRAINAKAFYANYNNNRQQSINHNIGMLRSHLTQVVSENHDVLKGVEA